MEYTIPLRANLYDRNGLGLAREGTIVTVGVIRGDVEEDAAVVSALAEITDLARTRYCPAMQPRQRPGRCPLPTSRRRSAWSTTRCWPRQRASIGRRNPGALTPTGAPHPTSSGWVAPVPAEQLDAYRARGYRGDEWVGIAGLESWGEDILSGRHGGELMLVTGDGTAVEVLSETAAVPGRAIYYHNRPRFPGAGAADHWQAQGRDRRPGREYRRDPRASQWPGLRLECLHRTGG